MVEALQAEWIKIRRSKIWWSIVLLALLPVLYSILIYTKIMVEKLHYTGPDAWFMPWSLIVMFYGSVFYPIISGLIATILCRFEHAGGGWKQILTLPVSKSHLYLSKLLWLLGLLAVVQGTTLILFVGLGYAFELDGSPPWSFLLASTLLGWIGGFPLVALQQWIPSSWKTFVIPMAINVFLFLPGFLVVASESALKTPLRYVYPWRHPVMGMMESDPSGVDPLGSPFLPVTLLCLAMFLAGGLVTF